MSATAAQLQRQLTDLRDDLAATQATLATVQTTLQQLQAQTTTLGNHVVQLDTDYTIIGPSGRPQLITISD